MKKIKMPICAFIAVILFAACQNGASKSGNNETTMTNDSASITSVEDKSESKFEFPQNVAMLLPTQYRKESTGYPKGVKEKEWYEFYKDEKSGKWIVAKADLKITYDRDECVGEDVMIIKSNHENAVFFFTPFEGLSKNIETAITETPIFPGSIVSFKLNNQEYKLSALSSVKDNDGNYIPENQFKNKSEEEKADFIFKDYQLSFIDLTNNTEIELVKIPEIQYATPTLIWAGDLNGDGLPDAVLSLPDFYESQHIFFFISDKNDKEKPLKKVADLMVVNDC